MKIAILLLCHKNTNQIKRMINALDDNNITFFIHLDKKSELDICLLKSNHVVLLDEKERVSVEWAQISQVDAALNLIKKAKSIGNYDYYWLCSGQDFPIKSTDYIINFFNGNKKQNFINFYTSLNNEGLYNKYDKRNDIYFLNWLISRNIFKKVIKRIYIEITGGYLNTIKIAQRKNQLNIPFYFGSQWWCLHNDMIDWILDYLNREPDYYNFYRHCLCPDESFFHTLVKLSPFRDNTTDYLHYIDWSEGNHSPKTLTMNDITNLLSSNKLMARKFDTDIDSEILNYLRLFLCT